MDTAGNESESFELDNRKEYNQYVWIPVDNINDMVMCKKHGATVTLNTTTLQCPTCLADTKLAGKLYATSTGENFNAGLDTQKYTNDDDANFSSATVKLREPDDLIDTTYGDAGSTGRTAIKGILNTAATKYADIKEDWNDLLQDDFENMAKSVAKYGGFYISRYEVGAGGSSKKEQTVLNNSGSINWWSLFSTLRSNPEVEAPVYSQMIWGSQYDQVMKFVNGKTDGTGETYDVKTASSTRHKGSSVGLEVSGNNNADLVCNIYDLEGNYYEWTSEAGGTLDRDYRGR